MPSLPLLLVDAFTDRHATYVDATAYGKHLRRVRRRLGWPELARGCYERLRTSGRAEAAA